jgi:hypothetical protein
MSVTTTDTPSLAPEDTDPAADDLADDVFVADLSWDALIEAITDEEDDSEDHDYDE